MDASGTVLAHSCRGECGTGALTGSQAVAGSAGKSGFHLSSLRLAASVLPKVSKWAPESFFAMVLQTSFLTGDQATTGGCGTALV